MSLMTCLGGRQPKVTGEFGAELNREPPRQKLLRRASGPKAHLQRSAEQENREVAEHHSRTRTEPSGGTRNIAASQ